MILGSSMVEQAAVNREVRGSSPLRGATRNGPPGILQAGVLLFGRGSGVRSSRRSVHSLLPTPDSPGACAMSEYQYYEFQAIDRPLSKAEMAAVRALSTRATITPTRFQNEYHWGDFKGDPLTLMERYYDAHLYFANWGTRILMLRLPRQLLDAETALRYCFSEWAEVHTKGDYTILEFRSENEEGEDWEEGPEGWLGNMIPLRADLMGGDLRALYISWLSCAEAGLLDDDDSEPPVPAGLGNLTAPLKALAGFLRVSDDLLAVAAEQSARRGESRADSDDLARWVATLPTAEKDALIV